MSANKYIRLLTNAGHFILYFVCVVIVVSGFIIAFSDKHILPGGYRFFTVVTGSMEPSLPQGSLVLARQPNDAKEIKKGEIVTFEQPGYSNKYITHRVYEKSKSEVMGVFTTKGDKNSVLDNWEVSYGRVQGVYITHLPKIGNWIEFLKTPRGLVIFVLVPALILILYELKNITSALVELRLSKEKKPDGHSSQNLKLWFLPLIIAWQLAVMTVPSQALFAAEPRYFNALSIKTGTWDNHDDGHSCHDDHHDHNDDDDEPEFDHWFKDRHHFGFRIKNKHHYEDVEYEITYKTKHKINGIKGEKKKCREDEYERDDMLLGTCTTDDCTYDDGVEWIDFHIKLKRGNDEKHINKRIDFKKD